jgi:hypothetical protein
MSPDAQPSPTVAPDGYGESYGYDQIDPALEWHLLLLGLAGRLPDEAVARCRRLLAADQPDELADHLVSAALEHEVPLFDLEIDILADALATHEDAEDLLAQLETTETGAALGCTFAAAPDDRPDSRQPDEAVVAAIAGQAGAVGLWRSFRVPAGHPLMPRTVPVYVVETNEQADLIGVATALQDALEAAGLDDAQVEVYPTGFELPSYQRLARANGELLWSRSPDPGVRIAVLFDEVHPTDGPRFHPNHPRADAQESPKLLGYLKDGEPLLMTTGRLDDVVDRDRGRVVPMSFRTDGAWVWSEATAYYLEAHGLQPDPALVKHIRAMGHVRPAVDGVDMHRAMATLRAPRA